MIELLTGQLLPWLLAAGAAIAAAFGIYTKGKSEGKQVEETKALKQNVENANVRQEVDRTVGRSNNAVGELRSKWYRD